MTKPSHEHLRRKGLSKEGITEDKDLGCSRDREDAAVDRQKEEVGENTESESQ